MSRINRVLIDWDLEASGIWLLPSYTLPTGSPVRSEESDESSSRPWRELLSSELLANLRAWNDRGDHLFGGRANEPDDKSRRAFRDEARALASCVQTELGDGWEVLYVEPGRAWTWIKRVWRDK